MKKFAYDTYALTYGSTPFGVWPNTSEKEEADHTNTYDVNNLEQASIGSDERDQLISHRSLVYF